MLISLQCRNLQLCISFYTACWKMCKDTTRATEYLGQTIRDWEYLLYTPGQLILWFKILYLICRRTSLRAVLLAQQASVKTLGIEWDLCSCTCAAAVTSTPRYFRVGVSTSRNQDAGQEYRYVAGHCSEAQHNLVSKCELEWAYQKPMKRG